MIGFENITPKHTAMLATLVNSVCVRIVVFPFAYRTAATQKLATEMQTHTLHGVSSPKV